MVVRNRAATKLQQIRHTTNSLLGNRQSASKKQLKSKNIGDMIDQVKIQALGETFEYIMIYFNLPVPEGGLFHVLKGLGLKI